MEAEERGGAVRPLLVTNDFPPQIGGIEQFALQLASRLPGVAVLAGAHPDATAHDSRLPFPVFRGGARFMVPSSSTRSLLRRAVAAHQADVVVFLSPLPLTFLGPSLDVPWAAVAHGAELTIPARLPGLAAVTRRRLASAAALFAVSNHTAGRLRALMGDDAPPIGLVRNGVSLRGFHPDTDGSAIRARHGLGDDPVLGCVGRLVPRKGQDKLVEALPAIREAVPGTRLLLVGGGRLAPRLERAARRLPPGAVVLTGPISGDELASHYAAADVFAHPNRSRWGGLEQEGFGIVFLEAQACGKPVIAGRSGGSPEALLDGETGLLVDGADPGDIAAAAIRLLGDPALAQRMGLAGRALVEERFSWDTVARGFARDLAKMAGGTAPSIET